LAKTKQDELDGLAKSHALEKDDLKKSLEDAKQLAKTKQDELDGLAKTHALEKDDLKKSLEVAEQLAKTKQDELDGLAKSHALEKDDLKKSLEAAEQLAKTKQGELDDLQKAHDAAQDKLVTAEEGKEELERKLAEANDNLQQQIDLTKQQKEDLDAKTAELQVVEDKLVAAEKRTADYAAAVATEHGYVQDLARQLDEAKKENDEVVKAMQLAGEQIDDLIEKEEQLKLIQDKFVELEQAYQDAIAKQKDDAQNKLQGANTNDQTDLADIVKQRDQLEKKLNATQDSLKNARANLAKSQLNLSPNSMKKRVNVSLPSNRANNTTLKMAQKTDSSTFNIKGDVNTRQQKLNNDLAELNRQELEFKKKQKKYNEDVAELNRKEPELKKKQKKYNDDVAELNNKGYGVNASRTTRSKHNELKEEPNRITSITTPNVHQRDLAKTLKTQEALKSSPGNQAAKSEQVTGERKELSAYSQFVKSPSRLPVIKGKELAINDEGRLTINKQSPILSKPKSEAVELKQEGGIQPFNNLKTIDETVTPNSKSLVKVEPTEEVADIKKLKVEVISPQMMVGINTSKVEQKGGVDTKHRSRSTERKIPEVSPRAVDFKRTEFKRAKSR
ncbi:MAG: hypothetical protein LN568_00765, partial [Rickettsia endosymbiont of Pseudomimeciton antennatum]|nr:hypothetical protein [Rickettsia endosymbiont of Pseudomimeciton antennatum]